MKGSVISVNSNITFSSTGSNSPSKILTSNGTSIALSVDTIRIGWADPNSSDGTAISSSNGSSLLRFNFHICLEGLAWEETVDYSILASLDSSITTNCETQFSHVQFPNISDTNEQTRVTKILLNNNEYNLDNVKILERHRKVMQRWASFLFSSAIINIIDYDSKEIFKKIFFRTPERIVLFDHLYKNSSYSYLNKNNSKPVPLSPQVSYRPRASSLGESNNTLIRRLTTNPESELTTKALNKLDNKKTIFHKIFKAKGHKTQSLIDTNEKNEMSDNNNSNMNNAVTLKEIKEKTNLLKIAVQRGQETTTKGVLVYEITLKILVKKTPLTYSTFQRYSNFKKLNQTLIDINTQQNAIAKERERKNQLNNNNNNNNDQELNGTSGSYQNFYELLSSSFPAGLKTYFGLTLNDSDLSLRTRLLDAWFRDVCYNYRNMPPTAKVAVRDFLGFNMSRQVDIFVQDQLAWGLIEAPRGESPILIVQKSALDTIPDEFLETLTNMDGNNSVTKSTTSHYSKSTFKASARNNNNNNDTKLQNIIWETASTNNYYKSKRNGSVM